MDFSGRRWITVAETAAYLFLHPVSVRRKIDRGEIVASRIGRTVRVDLKKLNEQMERGIGPGKN